MLKEFSPRNVLEFCKSVLNYDSKTLYLFTLLPNSDRDIHFYNENNHYITDSSALEVISPSLLKINE